MKTIQITIPDGVPAPLFLPFQKICWQYGSRMTEGTIIGIEYVDTNTALCESYPPGWWYRVSEIYGLTKAKEILERNSLHSVFSEETLLQWNSPAAEPVG